MRICRKVTAFLIAFSLAFGAFASSRTVSQKSSFKAAHIERSASITLEGSPEDVFALLQPLGRKKWIKRWNFEYLWPTSGEAQPGAVVRQAHQSGAVEQIWLLAEHEPPTRIKYVIFVAEMETWEFDTAVDPIYMIMFIKLLGPGYTVWDKAATIQFRRPGRSTLLAKFLVETEELESVRRELEHTEKLERVYDIDLIDEEGTICASVEKTLYFRKKNERTVTE